MTNLGTNDRPLRVAIIGSGPSGFYAAEELLQKNLKIKVDMYDRLPAPFGLVRYGVAPDHPKIKNVIKVYEKIASQEAFEFFGNVEVGKDVSIQELQNFYDAIIFASGAQTDRSLGVPGENLAGSYTATEFVAWYNGHPEYRNRQFDLLHEVVVIVGQGNVAMDVGRILSRTVEELKNTDITQYALEVLAQSKIKEVHLIGRRGPVQAAFTPLEIREFGELADCDPVLDSSYLNLNSESQAELNDIKVPTRRKNFEILKEFAHRPPSGKKRKFVIHFYKSPKELKGSSHLEKLVLEKNKLTGPAGNQQAVGTGELEEMSCGILFRSVGYRGVPIAEIPFDEKKGVIPNIGGRIVQSHQPIPGLYAVGWIKRGPNGVIGTNKPDSAETVQNLINDLPQLSSCLNPSSLAVKDLLKKKNIRFVTFPDWKKIDTAEIELVQKLGKAREKFTDVEKMLEVLNK